MKNFIEEIKNRILVYDGSKGYLLQKMGLEGGQCPELWNIEHPDKIKQIYSSYKEAGCDVIQTNTFQGSRIQLEKYSLGEKVYELNYQGAKLAKEVMGADGYVAASIGPIGKLFEPLGDLTFETAYKIFREQVKALVDGGVDIINFETFTDMAEMRAAFLAAHDVSNLPVVCSFAFESNGRTLMGTEPFIAALVMKSLGADMVGTNCSFGPEHMIGIVKELSRAGDINLSVKPNAGIPEVVDGEIIYNETAQNFARYTKDFVDCGARLIGGCCGTTPEFIREIKKVLEGLKPISVLSDKCENIITSSSKHIDISDISVLEIGQINAKEDYEIFEGLKKGDLECVTDRAMDLSEEDYDAIYINVDSVEGNKNLLAEVIKTAQGYLKQPLIIETQNHESLEYALRIYNGRAGLVIENKGDNNYENLLRTADKYGSVVFKFKPELK